MEAPRSTSKIFFFIFKALCGRSSSCSPFRQRPAAASATTAASLDCLDSRARGGSGVRGRAYGYVVRPTGRHIGRVVRLQCGVGLLPLVGGAELSWYLLLAI